MGSENQELRAVGLKVTLPRVYILQILERSETKHLSAEDVYKALIEAEEDVGLATVYRVLTQFESAGLVSRHHFEGGHSVFELMPDDHHDHMVDVDSNEVIEFVDEEIEARQYAIAAERGYEIIDHSLVLYVRKELNKLESRLLPGARSQYLIGHHSATRLSAKPYALLLKRYCRVLETA